jgi:hypothetical protein
MVGFLAGCVIYASYLLTTTLLRYQSVRDLNAEVPHGAGSAASRQAAPRINSFNELLRQAVKDAEPSADSSQDAPQARNDGR